MVETISMPSWGKVSLHLWTWENKKTENKLSVPKIQHWDRHRIRVTDILISKEWKWKEKRSHCYWAILKSGGVNSIRLQGLGIILCSLRIHPIGPNSTLLELLLLVFVLFFMVNTCLKLSSFITLFSTCRILGVWQPFFFYPVSGPFTPSWYNILKNPATSFVSHKNLHH